MNHLRGEVGKNGKKVKRAKQLSFSLCEESMNKIYLLIFFLTLPQKTELQRAVTDAK
jgi:hypothetical protein